MLLCAAGFFLRSVELLFVALFLGGMQSALFGENREFSEMWPLGPDSVDGRPPRNIRIAYIEDQLLRLANTKPAIRLVPHSCAQELISTC